MNTFELDCIKPEFITWDQEILYSGVNYSMDVKEERDFDDIFALS